MNERVVLTPRADRRGWGDALRRSGEAAFGLRRDFRRQKTLRRLCLGGFNCRRSGGLIAPDPGRSKDADADLVTRELRFGFDS
jgi:hypothetical protein